MRVLIVNTSEITGGAAVAANRLMNALNNNGVKAKMLVRDKTSDCITVVGLHGRIRQRLRFLWERWCIFCHLYFTRTHLFDIDIANSGNDITQLPEFREADVIHLSWVNQGMLSLASIRKIVKSGKAVVWTLHDAWPVTGICHYTRSCQAFKRRCHNCPLLPGGGSTNDLSSRLFDRKKKLYQNSEIHFVACSRWLAGQARQSALLAGLSVDSIPNPIDTRVFCPQDKREARLHSMLPEDKRIILFVSQRVTQERKGMKFFIEAIERMVAEHPEVKADTVIAVLGGKAEEVASRLPLPCYPLGYISDERRIVSVYNSADVFVLPSLEDNLPNTIMEALACGVPCVGFQVGGIPEMIDHQCNGYVAAPGNSADLAAGMHWVLREADYASLSRRAVQKVLSAYSQRAVAMAYIEVYNQALAFKHYHL